MTAITLFNAAQAVREIVATPDPETGEINESYADSQELFETKGVACVAYAIENRLRIEARKKMMAAMHKQVAAEEAAADRFDNYMAMCMKLTGTHRISDGLVTATLYPDRDVSVEIEDGVEFPPELCLDPRPPGLSKARIKAAILAGQPVAGARIVRRDRLTIR